MNVRSDKRQLTNVNHYSSNKCVLWTLTSLLLIINKPQNCLFLVQKYAHTLTHGTKPTVLHQPSTTRDEQKRTDTRGGRKKRAMLVVCGVTLLRYFDLFIERGETAAVVWAGSSEP